jgi:hypothetical protein
MNLSLNGQLDFLVEFLISSLTDPFNSFILFLLFPYLWQYNVTYYVPSYNVMSPLGMQIEKPHTVENSLM